MTSLVQKVVDGYNNIWELRDLRVEGWLFMSSPLPTLLICLTYVYIVKVAGPRLMKNRPAYELRGVLIVYNFIQVIFSTWIFYEYGRGGWFHGYSFRCQPVDYSLDDMAVRMVYACWWYYFSKFTEFFDTFFFVMRKKYEHVSLLHVVHHGIMPMSVWFGVRFTPGGHSTFFGLLNTFVHIVMYFYYMVAAMGPQYQKFIWWKKHLTTLQMIQFVMICIHAFQLLFVECNYPKAFVWWIGCHGVLFFALFSDFYVKAYIKKRAANKAKLEDAANGNAQENGHGKKYTNGYSNGHSNGHTNGHHENGYKNGSLHSKSD